ncbi:MAG: GNAT family N-acetyltransferase [Proteobacteria bacterium]|nr:GNAT family N-acetyltransferase [Pseudomonadota bacterium]MBI3497530.1 GNAT family N-acetyltransferase [Pseudomonadota bacterium]
MSPCVPTIETQRLTLRGHRVQDFEACLAMWADPEVTRFIGGKPFTGEEVWTRLLRYAGHWAWLGFGFWVVEEKVSGRFMGEVGFADYRRDIKPSLNGMPEIGWAFARWAHGAGFATEAVGAAGTWGDRHFAAARTVCMIRPDNLASIRVAEKCGYRLFERTTYKEKPTILFDRLPA